MLALRSLLPTAQQWTRYRQQWFAAPRADVLAGILVALALIPEAIAFSIIAGVDPQVGLYASFIIAMTIAFVGGRPAMISAATGAMALLMVTLVRDFGLEYLFAATILTGVLQILFGWAGLARYLKFVPRAVMVGFVNALAILIFMAQFPQLIGDTNTAYVLLGAALVIIYGLPRLLPGIPSPLVAIVALTALVVFAGLDVRTVGDMGTLPSTLPAFALPQVPLTMETLGIIFPVAATLAFVGLIESLLTAQLIDDKTDTSSNKNRESKGQGLANIVAGSFGGMAGCAMIGQSMINVTSGARGRLSTFVAGLVLLLLILLLQPLLVQIPLSVLVAVMFMVAFATFDWSSLKTLVRYPKSESLVMLSTVAVTVYTHDLSLGVLTGVVMSAILFVRKLSKLAHVSVHDSEDGRRTYTVSGQMFFVSSYDFTHRFDFAYPGEVVIDVSQAHFWDASAVAALDKVVDRYRKAGNPVTVHGVGEASVTLLEQLGSTAHLPLPESRLPQTVLGKRK